MKKYIIVNIDHYENKISVVSHILYYLGEKSMLIYLFHFIICFCRTVL